MKPFYQSSFVLIIVRFFVLLFFSNLFGFSCWFSHSKSFIVIDYVISRSLMFIFAVIDSFWSGFVFIFAVIDSFWSDSFDDSWFSFHSLAPKLIFYFWLIIFSYRICVSSICYWDSLLIFNRNLNSILSGNCLWK
jgi:hypothetical protein